MEPFEPIRAAAAKLHAELVAGGADPDRPLELLEAAIPHLDLELSWLPRGDVLLKGARAFFDEQMKLICCQEEPDRPTQATTLAHEIGHAVVHTGSTDCAEEDIDASCPTEVAPLGLQRVEDYGVRERRELQANVFARELCLPRASARRKHLEGQKASEIASSMELPPELVRQQLLDALLLPPIPADEPARREEQPHQNDPSQDEAAEHGGSALQLQAGPGTGKTRTLVKRVLFLLGNLVDPNSILALTFSNRAAGELSERLNAAAPAEGPRLWIGTFHAFGLDLIRRYHDKLQLPSQPKLFDRSDSIEVLQDILPTLDLVHYRSFSAPELVLKEILTAISRAKDELVDPEGYRQLAQAVSDPVAREKGLEVARVYEIYQQHLRDCKAMDFGDLIMRPAMLLEHDEAVRRSVQLRHRHVLVDEYQDVNRASARLLRALAGDGRCLWVVGDARQSIYRFRGASSINMTRFQDEYPDSVPLSLSINYRSSGEVVEGFQQVARRMTASHEMLPLNLKPMRGRSNYRPQLRCFTTKHDEAAGIAAAIRELESAGVRLRDQAVLCRSNSRLTEIAGALEARGIPVLHLGSLFERDEVRNLLALLTLATDAYGDGLARVGAMPRYRIPLQDVRVACALLRELPGPAAAKLHQIMGDASISPEGQCGLAQLAADLAEIPVRESAWQFLATYLLDRTNLLALAATREDSQGRTQAVALWQFLNFLRDPSPVTSGQPIRRLLDRVRQLVLLAEERDLRQIPAAALHMDAVRLMTVHASKGLEFEAVHLPGIHVGGFPAKRQGERCPPPPGMIAGELDVADAHAMEEECLFFVALSRARTYLRLYRYTQQPNGNARNPSPYLDWLSFETVRDPNQLPGPAQLSSEGLIVVQWPANPQLSASQLALYQKCPRRFFYTHILGLGSRQKPTALSKALDCVYVFIRWLTAERLQLEVEPAAATRELERLWLKLGPVEHAYAQDYRRLVERLGHALLRHEPGQAFLPDRPAPLRFGSWSIRVEPDEVVRRKDGTRALRKIQVGHRRKDELDRLEYALYALAAGPDALEGFFLADAAAEDLTFTGPKLRRREEKCATMVSQLAAGEFPTNPETVPCTRCPHFFICDAVASGPLTLTELAPPRERSPG